MAVSSFLLASAARASGLRQTGLYFALFSPWSRFFGAETAEIRHFRSDGRAEKMHTSHKFPECPCRTAARMGRRRRGAGKAAPGRRQEMSWSVMFLRCRPNSGHQVRQSLLQGNPPRKGHRPNPPPLGGGARGGVVRRRADVRSRHRHRVRLPLPLTPSPKGRGDRLVFPRLLADEAGGGGFEQRPWGMCGDVMKCHDSVGSGIRDSKSDRAFHRVFSPDGTAAARRSRCCTRPPTVAGNVHIMF